MIRRWSNTHFQDLSKLPLFSRLRSDATSFKIKLNKAKGHNYKVSQTQSIRRTCHLTLPVNEDFIIWFLQEKTAHLCLIYQINVKNGAHCDASLSSKQKRSIIIPAGLPRATRTNHLIKLSLSGYCCLTIKRNRT